MIIQGVTLKNVGFIVDAEIVSGSILNLDASTGVSGSTWINSGTSGSSLNYTLINSPTTTSVNGSTVLSFSGGAAESPGSMTHPYAFNSTGITELINSNQAFTLEVWCSPRAANAGNLVKEFGQSLNGVPSPGWEDSWIAFNNGNIYTGFWTGSGNAYATAAAYTQNNWYQVVMSYNGTNQLKTYVNNALGSTQNINRVANGTACMLAIAVGEQYTYLGGPNPYFTGYIGEFRIYLTALAAAAVTQNYNARRGRYGL